MPNMLSSDAHILGISPSDHNSIGGLGTANVYQPGYQQQNDKSFEQLIQSLSSMGHTGASAANSVVNNPYINQQQAGANNAGQIEQQIGAADRGAGQALNQNALAALPYGNQLLTNAFDPQQALYNKTLQQTEEQQNAQNAAMGLGMSGVGAGLQADNLQNFNIGWQNAQEQRQLAGLQGYDALSSTVGSNMANAANLKAGGANLIAQGAGLPYNTANTVANNDISAIANASGVSQQAISDILSYLQTGTQASNVGNVAAGQAFTNLNNTAGGLGNALGGSSIMSQLSSLFGGGSGTANGPTVADEIPDAGAFLDSMFLT